MSIKDRLSKKTEGMVPLEGGAMPKNVDAAPKTAPGQMLAFRSQLADHNDKVTALELELKAFKGSSQVVKLDPSKVVRSGWANRHAINYSGKDFAALKSEIEAAGKNIQPIKVRPKRGEAGVFEIVFGHRRHQACLELGIQVRGS
jgi:ParB family transcriptional regulator, chromosome partitioning protein